ncbi:hypothetical protein QAD02_018126 [Eretmocerus hayati]|uniref:Uncharacterized protein n=1 Tax=Eretmocerus hayati TaxID=131215 RepID=A0ACC2PGA3_9HYME|nr:hypothetical protein QAD02_018126 [Eretmocerus hayati]
MVTLCLVSICMGIIPMQLAKCFKIIGANQIGNPRSLKYVNCLLGFGGGVLFSTTFLHMMPEVEEHVEDLTGNVIPKLPIPFAKLLTCLGFFMMYLVEEVVHSCTGHSHQHHDDSTPGSNTSSHVNIYANNSIGSFGSVSTPDLKQQEKACDISHTHLDVLNDSLHQGALRGLLIVLGLSVHELFEGLSIGLEGEANHVWYMFGAVAAHKFIIAFCIGVELTSSRTSTILSYIYVCMFAVVSPLGIGIGMGLVGGHSAAANGLPAVVLQGIASGTLLYVVFFEILHKHRNGLMQYTSIAVGFALMAVIIAMMVMSLVHDDSKGVKDQVCNVPRNV